MLKILFFIIMSFVVLPLFHNCNGMQVKWYIRLAYFLGFNPMKIKVVEKDNALYMKGKLGVSKPGEHNC